ncbi:MAG: HAD family hydrolase [Nitrospina sp.]|jgi:phosphoglycolate phosphatase-like HAD superfamily hydrolase|nr:HAD family hydrolase [Nitrospina sp.]
MYTNHYDAIVFDFDGTLVKSNKVKTWAFGKLYEEYGDKIVKQVISYQNEHEGLSRFSKFRYWHKNFLHLAYTDEIGEKLSRSFSQLVFNRIVDSPYVEGAIEFLQKYYQILPLFVASATPENELREIIKRRSMNRYFREIYGSPAKKSEILISIYASFHWFPERILMVGDSLSDLEGAKSAFTNFVGLKRKDNSNLFPSSTVLIKDMTELEKIITNP